MWIRHAADAPRHGAVRAEVVAPQLTDAQITAALTRAQVPLGRLSVHNVGGIVVVGGNADAATARRAVAVIHDLGFARVANVVKVDSYDDEGLRRAAERQLAQTRSLNGCTLAVSCSHGVLRVSGTAQNDMQEDLARQVLRGVGAQEVRVELTRM